MTRETIKQDRKTAARGLGRAQTLALAAVAGTAAALLAGVGLARQTPEIHTEPTRPVVTAAQELLPRTVLSADMLRVALVSDSQIPPGAFSKINPMIGQVTTTEVASGQALTQADVASRSQTDGIAPQIAPTLRAVSIPLDAAGGASGFLEPGDHVDVMASFPAPDGQTTVRVVVSDARLLALNTREDAPATSATLEVTPRAALALASAQGHLTLALRGLDNDQSAEDQSTPLVSLSSAPATKPPSPPHPVLPAPPLRPVPITAALPVKPLSPPGPPQITVVRGTQTTTVTVGE